MLNFGFQKVFYWQKLKFCLLDLVKMQIIILWNWLKPKFRQFWRYKIHKINFSSIQLLKNVLFQNYSKSQFSYKTPCTLLSKPMYKLKKISNQLFGKKGPMMLNWNASQNGVWLESRREKKLAPKIFQANINHMMKVESW